MSHWQAYVDNNLVGSGHIDKAAIVGTLPENTGVWAASSGFDVKPEEIANIMAILAANGDNEQPAVAKALSEGIYVAGERYVAFNVADTHIYGRKGRTGIIIVQAKKNKQLFLIAQYGEDKVAGNATQVTHGIANHLDVPLK